mmetsp:Transcript_6911/g.7897  ORF Transcript_6911/g.7897 Transcript_6911/m.7897 type:complete len:397 (+) Transcript_6911:2-1192(+)
MGRGHNVVQISIESIVDKYVLQPLNDLLLNEFPAKKQRISNHEGLRKDLESYRRRRKKLVEKGRTEDDKDLAKIIRKLGRTQDSYTQMHTELLQDLTQTYADRHKTLQPIYLAIVVCQGALHQEFSDGFNVLTGVHMNSNETEKVRYELDDLIKNGGPSPEELLRLETLRSPNGMIDKLRKSFSSRSSRSFKNGSLKSSQQDAAASPKSSSPLPNASSSHFSPPSYSRSPADDHDANEIEGLTSHDSQPSAFTHSDSDHEHVVSPSAAYGDNGNSYEAEIKETEEFKKESTPSPSPVRTGRDDVDDFDDEPDNIECISSPRNSIKKTTSKVERVIAEHEYEEGDESDLSFSKGDIITVLQKIDDGWWHGEKEDGSVGWFPVTYVRPLETNDSISLQ